MAAPTIPLAGPAYLADSATNNYTPPTSSQVTLRFYITQAVASGERHVRRGHVDALYRRHGRIDGWHGNRQGRVDSGQLEQ